MNSLEALSQFPILECTGSQTSQRLSILLKRVF